MSGYDRFRIEGATPPPSPVGRVEIVPRAAFRVLTVVNCAPNCAVRTYPVSGLCAISCNISGMYFADNALIPRKHKRGGGNCGNSLVQCPFEMTRTAKMWRRNVLNIFRGEIDRSISINR